jgi:hypothetical protein
MVADLRQTAGKSGCLCNGTNIFVRKVNTARVTGLPFGNPGSGEEIEMAMQQAPQPFRHFMFI